MTVTCVMPVLGRALFTLRMLWYLDKIRFPYPLIIADGANDARLRDILKDSSHFPNLTFTHYCRRDVSPNAFMRKCLAAVSMVDTPYVMMIENDDFIFPRDIALAVAFLETNPDYVAAGGAVAGFNLSVDDDPRRRARDPMNLVLGEAYDWRLSYDIIHISADDPMERVASHYRDYFPTYYCVHRTEVLREAYEVMADTIYNELLLHELYLSLHTVLRGKVRTFPNTIGYLREANLGGATLRRWSEIALSPAFWRDHEALVDAFAAHAAPYVEATECRRVLVRDFGNFLHHVFTGEAYFLALAGRDYDLLGDLRSLGASVLDIRAMSGELRLVKDILGDDSFFAFVNDVGPKTRFTRKLKWRV